MERLALFDLDNTLISLAGAFRLFVAEFAQQHGLEAADLAWFAEAGESGYLNRAELFEAVRSRCGLGASSTDLLTHYRARMPELVRCEPEVFAGLADLRVAGWRLGIVTNGNVGNQQAKVDLTGLAAAVDAVCVSEGVGIRKPDPRIFRLAIERAGCSADGGGWMVGDNAEADIEGGRAAGLRTIWVAGRADAEWPRASEGPDHIVESVVEAISLLR